MIKSDWNGIEIKGTRGQIIIEIIELIKTLKEKNVLSDADWDFIRESLDKNFEFDITKEDPEIIKMACAMAATDAAMSGNPKVMEAMSNVIDEINQKLKDK